MKADELMDELRARGVDPSGAARIALSGWLEGPWLSDPDGAVRRAASGAGARACCARLPTRWLGRKVEWSVSGAEWQVWRFAKALEAGGAALSCGGAQVGPAPKEAPVCCDWWHGPR